MPGHGSKPRIHVDRRPSPQRLARLVGTGLVLVAAAGWLSQAKAQEVYLKAGFPGVGLGLGQAINDTLNVRGEFSTAGSMSRSFKEGNVDYDGKFKSDMAGIYLDGFVAGNFRLTGGLSFNDVKASGTGVPTGSGSITINQTTIAYGPADNVSFSAKLPSVTPYLGIGWGHALGSTGWSFIADLGINIGKFKARVDASQSIVDKLTLAGRNAQADIDVEQQKLQDKFDKYSVWPVMMIGVAYRF